MTKVQISPREILNVFRIKEPFQYVVLAKDPMTHEIRYDVFEPTLIEEEKKQLQMIREFLFEQIDITMSELGSGEKAEEYLRDLVRETVKNFHIQVNECSLGKILYYIIRDYVGYGMIDVMMKDNLIEDIGCNGLNIPVYVWHRDYESVPSNVAFASEEELDSFIIRLAYRTGRMISLANPMLDATLPDGSRIHATYGRTITKHGSAFTIRKFRADPLTIVDMIRLNTLSSEIAAVLWYLIESKHNVLVCGPTASGKTTMLNCLSSFIDPNAKIVTIEDTPELQLHHENWIRLVTRSAIGASAEISLFDLLTAALRQRPDYLIIGEIRGKEGYTLFQAMATGHLSLSTLHADSITSVMRRLESEPINIPKSLISGLNVITIQERMEREGRPIRRTTVVAEIIGLDQRTNEIITNDVFRHKVDADVHQCSGRCHFLEKISIKKGKTLDETIVEVNMRKKVLEWMVRRGTRSYRDVSEVIRNFYANKEEVFMMASVGT